MLPESFVSYISGSIGSGFDSAAFASAMEEPASTGIRLNRRKCTDVAELGYGRQLQRVPWCASGYYLDQRPVFTLNPLLHAGCFYVQDPSSMVYEEIISRIIASGRVGETPSVADLCAAPGGKTTAMINALPNGSAVLANECMPKRAAVLRENLLKWGYPEITVTNSEVGRLARCGLEFDIVAVDAPCSGEGMMRKDPDAVAQWSPRLVESCAALQRDILSEAVRMVRPGGFLIYSTCTFNSVENERNCEWLAETCGLEPVDLGFPSTWGCISSCSAEIPALRFMPHLTRGEGFFAAVFRKRGESIGKKQLTRGVIRNSLGKGVKILVDGIPQLAVKGKVSVPASESVLSCWMEEAAPAYPFVDLSYEEALAYLGHEALRLPSGTPLGYVAVGYGGHPLGLVKNIGSRANNMYPHEWKIRNRQLFQ